MYKVEKYLDECVSSIVNQTYSNLEIILVDDGSPDNCPAMCDEWAKKDSRIKVIHKANGGLSSARNAGIDIASGDFLSFVDSDDYIVPEMYEILYSLLKDYDADMSICRLMKVNGEGNHIPDVHNEDYPDGVMTGIEAIENWMNGRVNYIVAFCKLYKKFIFENIRYPEGRINEDEFMPHRIFTQCRKVSETSRQLYMYRQREGSIMDNIRKNFSIKRTRDVFCIYHERFAFFSEFGNDSFTSKIVLDEYSFLLNTLKKCRYLKYRKDLNPELAFVVKEILKRPGLKMKLRPVKLLLFLCLNVLGDILHLKKFPPEI